MMFEIGNRYAEDGSDWKQYEIISRQGNTVTYVKLQHTEQYNEKKSETKKAKVKQWRKGEVFITSHDKTVTAY